MRWRRKKIEPIGPSPLHASLYASRHLPVGRVVRWGVRTGVGLAMLVVLLGIGVGVLYRIPGGDALLAPLSRVLPIPAARVNGQTISYHTYTQMLDGWVFLYERQGVLEAVGRDTVERRVMDRLVQDVLVSQMLREMHVTVTIAQEDEAWKALAKPYGSEVLFVNAVQERFGWDAEAFRRFVVEPLVRLRAADDAVLEWREAQVGPRAVVDALYADVRIAPDKFEEMATQTSASFLSGDGEEVGLRSILEYPAEARQTLTSIPVGAVTDVVELRDRFVLYRVVEREDKDDEVWVKVRELSIEKRDVHNVLREWTTAAKIRIYVR